MDESTDSQLPDPKERPTLSVDAVATILGIDRKTVYAAINSGELPCLRIGRRILVPTTWLAARIGPDSDGELFAGSRPHVSQPPIQGELPLPQGD